MAGITVVPFGRTENGEETALYKIVNESGAGMTVCSYGGSIVALEVPDREGNLKDVVLGYDHLQEYERGKAFFGALIGRCGNRIAGGRMEIDGQSYQLAVNSGSNHLHGGVKGFDKKVWDVHVERNNALHLHLTSPDLDEQYPGKMEVDVRYTFDDENRLVITYHAVSDRDTLCNLTNHVYFNLAGHDSGTVEDQIIQIHGNSFLPVDENLIPTGEIRSVTGTPFDFRMPKPIGRDIGSEDEQIKRGEGYDHNYVLNHQRSEKIWDAAAAYSKETGISLICKTTQPGMQFYTGNHVLPQQGKRGASYRSRQGFCMETQAFPDAVHHENFPSVLLKAGEVYEHKTVYEFGTEEPF
ncbi:MAG: aldose epimerase family protein [Ruminococcus sp.]|jgi:aldose 1-epimerase